MLTNVFNLHPFIKQLYIKQTINIMESITVGERFHNQIFLFIFFLRNNWYFFVVIMETRPLVNLVKVVLFQRYTLDHLSDAAASVFGFHFGKDEFSFGLMCLLSG